ncbi:MAG: mRNA surveillance protein pelota [Nanoarchaeota archaeon]
MKLLKKDLKHNFLHIQVTNPEDLWYLSQIIEKNDLLTGRTERKVKAGSGDITKKTCTMTIQVEKIEFSSSANQLRVSGKVCSEHEDISKGSYHTIDIEIHSVIKIEKSSFSEYINIKLDEACKASRSEILILVMDRREAAFALLRDSGLTYLDEFQGEVEEKRFKAKFKEGSFYDNLVSRLKEYSARFSPTSIIIASPAFFKDDLYGEIGKKASELKKKINLASCNSTGRNGVNEVLKRDEVKKVLENERIYQETAAVEEFLAEVSKGNLAVYGLKEVEEAANFGAVKTILISEELVKEKREKGTYHQIDNIMKQVSSTKGKIMIISPEHEAGKKLLGLTGIGALLRFKII